MAVSEGGGGSSSTMCEISPSDQIGIINNLMDRIAALERVVSQLSAVNVSANQLSDISQQIGWAYNITYMGQPGWTQTEYGTLIPPAGWSLSSLGLLDYAGNPYQNMVLDSDGVLQWGVDSDAHISGAAVGAASNFAVYQSTAALQPSLTSGNFTVTATMESKYDANSIVTLVSGGTGFQVNTSGFYLLSAACPINVSSPTSLSLARLQWNISSNSTTYGFNHNYGAEIITNESIDTSKNGSRAMYISSGATHSIVAQGAGASTQFSFGFATIFIQLLKAV